MNFAISVTRSHQESMSRYPFVSQPLGATHVSLVCPRASEELHHSDKISTPYQAVSRSPQGPKIRDSLRHELQINDETSGSLMSLADFALYRTVQSHPTLETSLAQSTSEGNDLSSSLNKSTHRKRNCEDAHKFRRREQCRANQARYRHKQKSAQLQLEMCAEQLHKELETLKLRYRVLTSRERINESPWSIVADVFQLLDTGFRFTWRLTSIKTMAIHAETRQLSTILERSFSHDAEMGELQGVDAIMEQLLLFLQYFGVSNLQLQKIERVAPNVMAARANISLTLTKFTLRHAFPHLEESMGASNEVNCCLLYQRLLEQHLECQFLLTFFFDEESNRVARLAASIDLMTPLLRVLGSLRDVKVVLERARVSEDCVIREKGGFIIS